MMLIFLCKYDAMDVFGAVGGVGMGGADAGAGCWTGFVANGDAGAGVGDTGGVGVVEGTGAGVVGPGAGVGAGRGATGELLVLAAIKTAFLAKVRKGVLVASDCRMVWSDCWSRLLLIVASSVARSEPYLGHSRIMCSTVSSLCGSQRQDGLSLKWNLCR